MTTHHLDCCAPETDLAAAAKQMKEANRGVLPVVNRKNKIIGMITDRDICLAIADKPFVAPSKIRVAELLNGKTVYTVKAADDISAALREMRRHRVNRLPVTDGNGALTGILSLDTILAHAAATHSDLGPTNTKKESLAKTIKSIYNRNSDAHEHADRFLPAKQVAPAL
jgi:CBS domain-containing protein